MGFVIVNKLFDIFMSFSVVAFFFTLLLMHKTHSLVERKEQWRKEKEEKRRTAPDPTVPAGHTLLPESERQETLKSLKHSMYHPSDTVYVYVQPYSTNYVFCCFFKLPQPIAPW